MASKAPRLRMPFPGGSVAYLMQGNATKPPLSHANDNCLHALDFISLNKTIVAAASGRVAQVFSSAVIGDFQGGFGFGNFVKIEHENGSYTFYSHLDNVDVSDGMDVICGQKLGSQGCTGWTTISHLHFSLHQGRTDVDGVYETTEIESLLTCNLKHELNFQYHNSTTLIGGNGYINLTGNIYGSENFIDADPLVGYVSQDLEVALLEEHRTLTDIISTKPQLLEGNSTDILESRDCIKN